MTFKVRYAEYDRMKQIAAAGVLFAGMATGTGGDSWLIDSAKVQNHPAQYSYPLRGVVITPIASEVVASVVNPIEYLNRIEEVLQVGVSDLAKMLSVSRQAIYKWKNGDSIGDDSAHKLEQLALAADVFVASDTEVAPFMLRRTVQNDQNFLELVQQGASAEETAKLLVKLIRIGKQETAAIDAYLATKKNRRTDSIVEEFFPLPFKDH